MFSARVRIGLALALVVALSGCGQQSKQYASSNKANTFFTVPNSWNKISAARLSAYEKKQLENNPNSRADSVIWQVAYTPMKKFKLSQVYALDSFKEPIVVARVRKLSIAETNNISYNVLRDIVIPYQTWTQNPNQAPPGFSIVSDYEISDQGVNGVRSIFTFDNDGKNQTLDQVAMVSDDRRTLYVFLTRCITTCYKKNKKEIDEIVKSFTVRGKK